jgi:hypothetical protein
MNNETFPYMIQDTVLPQYNTMETNQDMDPNRQNMQNQLINDGIAENRTIAHTKGNLEVVNLNQL